MRSSNEAQAVVADEGRFTTVFGARKSSHDVAPLQVKEVTLDDHRYVVCPERRRSAERTPTTAKAIVQALRTALGHGDKALVGNKGYRRFLQTHGERFTIDEAKIEDDVRFDGLWVVRTNTTSRPATSRSPTSNSGWSRRSFGP